MLSTSVRTTISRPRNAPAERRGTSRRRNASRSNLATSPTTIWRGLAASCKGHYQDAIKVLEMVKRKDDPVLLTYLGYHHRKLGDVDLGIILYKQALDVDPENVDTPEYLGEGYVTVGQLDLARLELSEIEKRHDLRGVPKALQSLACQQSLLPPCC